MKKQKLNVLLALTDSFRVKYKNMIMNYNKYFTKSQGDFKGEKKTYIPKEGTVDEPTKRGIKRISTTVDEKFDYLKQESKQFIDALFSQEKTNSSGVAKAELIVGDKNWGEFTSLELLKLKSLLESSDIGNLEQMLSSIPVRSDNEIWKKTTSDDYTDRNIYETELVSGVAKTTVKTNYILEDPNLKHMKDTSSYNAKVAQRDDVMELGDYTHQKFSGEWSHSQRANALKRKDELKAAVIVALKKANDVESIASTLKADTIFDYILYGKN